MKIITHKEAKKQGLKKYFTEEPCKHKHMSERYTANRGCVECKTEYRNSHKNEQTIYQKCYRNDNKEESKEYSKIYREVNKEQLSEKKKEYYQNNSEKIRKRVKKYVMDNPEKKRNCDAEYRNSHKEEMKSYQVKYYLANKEEILQYHQDYYLDNKEQILVYNKDYYLDNKEQYFANYAKRRAAKLQATPVWYVSEKKLIEFMYKYSKDLSESTGILHHVDHIIPLINKDVCGLHCKDNLQVITATENLKKHNKFTGE